jgi:MtrB/PioB family decaheme-associated outer membrane protein
MITCIESMWLEAGVVRGSVRARAFVACALLGFGSWSHAETDPEVVELTQPKSVVEVGVAGQDRYSAKANEYNGVTRRNPYALGGFDINGGDAYDSDGVTRWRVRGSDLGLDTRSIEAEYGMQGRFRVRLGYDELRHNLSDSYQTPYGGVGSNVLTLPSNWLPVVVPTLGATTPNARGLSPDVTASPTIVGGVLKPPTAAQAAAATALQAADLPAFRNVDLFTQRSRSSIDTDVVLDDRWSANASFTREHRTGLRALGAQSRATDGDTSSILPAPIDDDDNRFAAGVSYAGDNLRFQAGYEGSYYRNNVPSVTWSLWAAPTVSATAATAPSNFFHKLSASGSYEIAPQTRLVAAASYGRNTQDENLLHDSTALLVPVQSAQALVVTESASLKLLHKLSRAWSLNASYKYDLRENRTPVNIFGFYDNNNSPTGTSPFNYLAPSLTGLGQNFNFNANTPYSRRTNQFNVDAEYHGSATQRFKVGAEQQNVDRYCLDTWINCADARTSRETTLRAEWRASPIEELTTNVGVALANRKVDYDENAFLAVVPMAGQAPSTDPAAIAGISAYQTLAALGLTGYGRSLGLTPAAPAGSAEAFFFPLNNALNNLLYGNENRISELIGMRRYDQADRKRARLYTRADWQASEKLSFQFNGEASQNRYSNSTYGLQRGMNWALNLDGTYVASKNLTATMFASFESQRARVASNSYTANSTATSVNGATAIDGGCFATIALRNANNKIDPCLDWQSTTRDVTTTVGASFTAANFLSRRFTLSGNAAYSLGKTDIGVIGGNYVNNPFAGVASNPTANIAAFFIPASALPTVSIRSLLLRLVGLYRIDRDSAIRFAYSFQYLRSSDWAYDALQAGGLTQVLPTNEQPPRYGVHSIGIAYAHEFR